MDITPNHNRAFLTDMGLTACAATLSPLVPSSCFKYVLATQALQMGVSSIYETQHAVSEFDNFLYHGGLFLLFKGLLSGTPLNSEFLLTSLSSPAIQRYIVNSPQFQRAKSAFALNLLRSLADKKNSMGKIIAFSWVKSYLNSTPMVSLFKDINFNSSPEEILQVFKDSSIDLFRKKRDDVLYLASEAHDQAVNLTNGHVDAQGLEDLVLGSLSLMDDFGLEKIDKSTAVLSMQGLSRVVGYLALNFISSPIVIIANTSRHPTLREVTLRSIGAVAAFSINGLAPIVLTEMAVATFGFGPSQPIEGEIVPRVGRFIKNAYDNIRHDLRTNYGASQKVIKNGEKLFAQALLGSAIFLLKPSLPPSIHAFTNLHLINKLVPAKKIEVLDAMLVQSITAVVLTGVDFIGGSNPALRMSVNMLAILLNQPYLMTKMIENDVVKSGSGYIKDMIPGACISNSYKGPLLVADTLAPYSEALQRGAVVLRVARAAHISKKLIDDLGGIQRIQNTARATAASSVKFYTNYTVFGLASSVLGFPGGVVAVGAISAGSQLSKAIHMGAAGAIYYTTGSTIITTLAVTAIQLLNESTVPITLAQRVRNFFGR